MPYYFYAVSVFLAAFLLFQIQPMIGKFLLPWYGGTPTVWSTILLFSQVLLTGGYAYAYWLLGRKRTRLQGTVHLIFLAISLGLLLYTTIAWPSPLTPNASWRPQGSELPVLGILRVLVVAIGVPFLLLSSTSTLMQSWFYRDFRGPAPYRLYAISNTGSLLALLTYPIIFEPNLTLRTQAYLWAFGYVGFVLLAGYLSFRTYRWVETKEKKARKESKEEAVKRPSNGVYLLWIALAACASTLLIATTSQITQEIAVVPFLWVLPLAIYLLTFILAFAGGTLYSRWVYLGAFIVVALASRMLLVLPGSNIVLQVFIVSLLLFLGCMLCHNELYKLRPKAQYLPSFYLMVALGGAVGGIFVNLVAPSLFSTGFWELQWGLIAVIVLMAIVIQSEYRPGKGRQRRKEAKRKEPIWRRIKPVVFFLAAVVVLGTAFVIYYMSEISSESQLARRNFYGVLRVWELNSEQPDLIANQLTHGKTAHGFQFENEALRALPTTYFTPTSGVGLTLLNHTARPGPLRVGALGLGIGVVSAYGFEDDLFRFYEVNPDVIRIAEGEGDYFSYLENSDAIIEVVEGDARVSLEQELLTTGSQEYDLLILDTFSGDTMPLHLLTKEAFEIYLDHLTDDGIMAINVSNRLFNLSLPIYMLADALDLQAVMIESPGDGIQSYDSAWMLLTNNQEFLLRQNILLNTAERPSIPDNLRLWTDDFSNLFQILK